LIADIQVFISLPGSLYSKWLWLIYNMSCTSLAHSDESLVNGCHPSVLRALTFFTGSPNSTLKYSYPVCPLVTT